MNSNPQTFEDEETGTRPPLNTLYRNSLAAVRFPSSSDVSPRARLTISSFPHLFETIDSREAPSIHPLRISGLSAPTSVFLQSLTNVAIRLANWEYAFDFWFIPDLSDLLYININKNRTNAKVHYLGNGSLPRNDRNPEIEYIVDHHNSARLKPGRWRIFPDCMKSSVRVDLLVLGPRHVVEYDIVNLEDWKRTQKEKNEVESAVGRHNPPVPLQSSAYPIGTTTETTLFREPAIGTGAQAENSVRSTVAQTRVARIRISGPFHGCPDAAEDDLDKAFSSFQLRHLETYECILERRINVGTTNKKIYKGIHTGYGAVAVKLYRFSPDLDCSVLPKIGREWANEVHILKTIGHHDSIVKYLGHDGRLFSLYYEYLPFEDLSRWRDEHHFFTGTVHDAREVLKDISSALEHIHGLGIAHYDIKPSNILYDRNKGATLINFCIAAPAAAFRSPNKVFKRGTPWYVPPEYIFKHRDTQGDVYALGLVLLYVLCFMKLPDHVYEGWSIPDVIECEDTSTMRVMEFWLREVEGHRVRLPTDNLGSIVRGMLQQNPNSRLTSKQVHDQCTQD